MKELHRDVDGHVARRFEAAKQGRRLVAVARAQIKEAGAWVEPQALGRSSLLDAGGQLHTAGEVHAQPPHLQLWVLALQALQRTLKELHRD
ncbi:MAG: hypothetical protein ACKOGB_11805, partial [Betaproteobacteria bacterium]